MTQLDTARFQSTDRYIAYLETTEGKLRLDLGWMNLREFLPATTGRALDVGSGTGPFAFRLAELGFTVDLLDTSDAMLAIAREQADSRELSRRTFGRSE